MFYDVTNVAYYERTNKVYNVIIDLFKQQFDTLDECLEQIKHYQEGYTNEPDYHLFLSATIFLSNPDIIHMYTKFGFINGKASNETADFYERQFRYDVGFVARWIIANYAKLTDWKTI